MTRRTGKARVAGVEGKRPAIAVRIVGGPVPMTPELAAWIRLAVDRGTPEGTR